MTNDNQDALHRADEICQYHRRGYETEDQAKLRRQESHNAAAAHLRRLVAQNEAKDALLRQALDEMEINQYAVADTAPHKDVMKFNERISAIRQHLKGRA